MFLTQLLGPGSSDEPYTPFSYRQPLALQDVRVSSYLLGLIHSL